MICLTHIDNLNHDDMGSYAVTPLAITDPHLEVVAQYQSLEVDSIRIVQFFQSITLSLIHMLQEILVISAAGFSGG